MFAIYQRQNRESSSAKGGLRMTLEFAIQRIAL